MSGLDHMCAVRAVLGILRDAASRGARCPTNEDLRQQLWAIGLTMPAYAHPAELAYAKHIRVEVYGRNYRVVEIDGMRTAEPPEGGQPYLVIDRRHER